ncbi:hypothetical protein [Marinivivus vitaminiproducens]|uniref:hypothetical protein n=1 Tax=Marinivivus vitaminiproducens TaxID=3035935 RepID=UPI0027A03CA7|nr:hypothetical protein P4R82_13475 [Geminicoccaceae bacterium SCSIO 64248]
MNAAVHFVEALRARLAMASAGPSGAASAVRPSATERHEFGGPGTGFQVRGTLVVENDDGRLSLGRFDLAHSRYGLLLRVHRGMVTVMAEGAGAAMTAGRFDLRA